MWLSRDKTIERVAKQHAALPGWSLRRGTRHWQLLPPPGFVGRVTIPGTPSGCRMMANFVAQVARLRRLVEAGPPPERRTALAGEEGAAEGARYAARERQAVAGRKKGKR